MHTAYVDESEPGGGRDHTAYVMAAAIVDDRHADLARDAVRSATPKRMRKLHWYEATDGQRLTWIGLLVHTAALVVVFYDGAPARAERRRRRCLERLVWELERREVHVLVLESRGSARDSNDASMLESLRARGVGRNLRYEHLRGSDEPLLALADTACGAHLHGMILAPKICTVVAVG